jgi:F0F1-type ATP synthase gamma subunit
LIERNADEDFIFLGEIIQKLTLTYNRTRQAVITRELIEIISGASAL